MQIQRPSFIQEQRLKMNPQLYQSIKLMELPIVDLREKIEEELERNPALEVLEDHSTVSLEEAYTPVKEEETYFENASDAGFIRRGSSEDTERQHKFIEGVLSRPETLQEHLLWQLRLQPVDDEIRAIGELLIQNLNADGFHKEPVSLLLKGRDRAGAALRLIRSLDPQGTCTSGYEESLRVQAALLPHAPPGLPAALNHLELLEKGRFAELAKKINRGEDEVRVIAARIKELSPFPGRQFSSEDTRYVVPDIQVMCKEGEFVIILNDEEIPVLGINPFFMELSSGKKKKTGENSASKEDGKPVRDFVRENIKEARWFIQSITQRNHTLLRVSRAVVEFQRAFFTKGPKHLVPLTLKDIAGELGVHETTVSRTSNGKYMQTEWGIFELKHFFTNSISGAGSSGSRYSKEGVKEIIRELIQGEARHFSDQELSGILTQRGIPLARRTVAKYRKELDLGSSYDRQ
ncbi:MAG: RNA polymerase factor sigma-54 [Spirochaetaceae bacterium]|nr:RNA polymerase factor sigma-54 [Spirochaetaceae bacterium]